jgi:hypothetical protein
MSRIKLLEKRLINLIEEGSAIGESNKIGFVSALRLGRLEARRLSGFT